MIDCAAMGGWRRLSIVVEDRMVAARETGGPGRPDIVLLHGLSAHQRSWDRVARKLRDRVRVLTFDYRGHGRSDPADRYSVDGLLADLQAVIVQGGVRPGYVLVGHSIGADVSLLHASRTSDCGGVVLVDGALTVAPPPADWERFSIMEGRFLFKVLMFLGRRLGVAPSMSFGEIRWLTEDVEARRRHFDALLSNLSVPVLYVIGNEPDKVPDGDEIHKQKMSAVSTLISLHPGIPVEFLPCGHLVPLRQPDALGRLVTDFVSRQQGR